MIVLAGIPSEPPLQMVAEALEALQQDYIFWNQRRASLMQLDYEVRAGEVAGVELQPGIKDHAKVRAFVAAARGR